MNLHNSEAVNRLLDSLGVPSFPVRGPRYNITPGSTLDILFDSDQFAPMDWGIAFGAFRHPNTKTETIKRKPHLQRLLLQQRCVVPVNRFYEWPDPKVRPKYRGIKTRFCIHTPNDVILLGGMFKIDPDGVMQFNVITTDPNDAISDFHHRMPVIIDPKSLGAWFSARTLDELYGHLVPYRDRLEIYECSAYVDNGRHDGPRCMEPVAGERLEAGDSPTSVGGVDRA